MGRRILTCAREHLKRKHTPVQCERCYHVFSGPDKARCINELTEHLRLEVPCQKGESVLKEGISEAQWAALDKQNRKKNQEKHKVEKWFEIWRVLFPEVPEPETPCKSRGCRSEFLHGAGANAGRKGTTRRHRTGFHRRHERTRHLPICFCIS